MVKIPLQAIPNQQFQVVLDDQNCTIHLYQRGDYMYMDLSVDGEEIRRGCICLPKINIPAYENPNFSGLLFFVDMDGKDGAPYYEELNDRYVLFYDEGDE